MYSSIPSTVQFGMVSTFDVNGKRISTARRLPLAAATWIGFAPSGDAKNIQKLFNLAMKFFVLLQNFLIKKIKNKIGNEVD